MLLFCVVNRTEKSDSHTWILLWRMLFICPFADKKRLMNRKHYRTLHSWQSGPFDADTTLNDQVSFSKVFHRFAQIMRHALLNQPQHPDLQNLHDNLFPILSDFFSFIPIKRNIKNKVSLFVTHQECLSGALVSVQYKEITQSPVKCDTLWNQHHLW